MTTWTRANRASACAALLLTVAACTWRVERGELRANPAYHAGQAIVDLNFEKLAACYDEYGPRMKVEFKDVTSLQVFPGAGKASIIFGDAYGIYGIVDLIQLGPDKTQVRAYGTGTTQADEAPAALEFLKTPPVVCSK